MPRITCICWAIFFSYGLNLINTCSREPRNMTVKLIYNMPRHWYRSSVASTSVINDKWSDVKGSRVKINTGYIGDGECVPENAAWQIRRLPAFVRRLFLLSVYRQRLVQCTVCTRSSKEIKINNLLCIIFVIRQGVSIFNKKEVRTCFNYFSMFYTHHKTPCLSQSV